MGVTTVTSNHDVPTVEQSTDDAPDNYSLVNTTEKAVEVRVVDENLPTSQKNIDSRRTSVNPKDATAHLEDRMRNNDESHYWSDINLQDTGLGFDADEEISSETSVKKRFDKMEFLLLFTVQTHIQYSDAEEAEQESGASEIGHHRPVHICVGTCQSLM